MRRMKICFWGNIFSAFEGKPEGGTEKQVAALGQVLSKMGHEIVVADTRIQQDVVVKSNFIFLSLRSAWLSPLPQRIWRLQRFFDRIGADVYYSRLRSIWHFFPYLASKKNKALFVLGLSADLDSADFRDRYKFYYSRNGWRKLTKQLIHSELMFRYLVRKADIVFAQHGGQIENLRKKGIEALLCPNIAPAPKPELINPPFSNYYILVGKLDQIKGLNRITEFVSALPAKNFVIIGRPANIHAKVRVDELARQPNLVYLGQLPNPTVLGWLSRADALVVPSIMEGFPNTMLESWALGTPVISLNCNPNNVFKHRFLGEFCDGNMEQLISALESFVPGRCDKKNMREYVKRRHSAESVGQDFLHGIDSHMQKDKKLKFSEQL